MSVDVAIYDFTGHPMAGAGIFGNDDIYINVYDDASGFPGALRATVTLPAGTYAAYPTWTTADFSSFNLVFESDFHVAFSSAGSVPAGDYEACLSDDGTYGVGRSSSIWPGSGGWVPMIVGWGADVNFLFEAYLCKDEYSLCSRNSYNNGIVWYWKVPDNNPITGWGQKIKALGEDCRVQEVTWWLYGTASPNEYTYNSEISVWTDAGGVPGTKQAGITVTPADYLMYPAGTMVDFEPLGIYISSDFYWIVIESFAPDTATGIRILVDDGGGGMNDGLTIQYGGNFYIAWSMFAPPFNQDWASYSEAEHCCIPFEERDCFAKAGEDWATYQHDNARTGASFNIVGDAWCDMTCNWGYEDLVGHSFAGPIIAYGKVVCSFINKYIAFDLITGVQQYTLGPGGVLGGSIRSTPTVGIVGTAGDTLLFTSGGDQRSVQAWNFSNGAGPVWNFQSIPHGNTRWGRFVLLNIGGTDVLYYGTDDGYVFALDATTGALYGGWAAANPVALTLSTFVSGSTDGENLFYGTYSGGAVEGDVYSIDAATGAITWQLSVTGPLQGALVWTHANGYLGNEGFSNGLSYEEGVLYTASRVSNVPAYADYPTDGLAYRINSNTGAVLSAVVANRGYYQTPIIDRNRVYFPSLTIWSNPPLGGNLYAMNKNTGNIDWAVSSASAGRYYCDGILTCEPEGKPDLIYAFNEDGFLSCFSGDDGNEIYRRRLEHSVGYPWNMGNGGAIGPDADGDIHITFVSYWGDLCDYTKQVDRPRLEIQTYHPTKAVEFGPLTSLKDTIYDVFVNTGCATLNFLNVTWDEIPSGQGIPDFASSYVDPSFMDRAAKIADKLARDAFLSKYLRLNTRVLDEDNILSARETALDKETINRAAAGPPPYLNNVDFPATGSIILAGDTADLCLDIIQTAINRGPQAFYILMQTDDPDFFMCCDDSPVEIHVTLVGGCLIDTCTLWFGMTASPNFELVTNTGLLGLGDWTPHGFEIDGDGSSYYQGSYVYAVDSHSVATYSQDWTSGGGWADAFVSMQPDPNWCDNSCKPYLDAGVTLGEMTHDLGMTYDPIIGNMCCKSFLDSVQNFDLGAGWDWQNWGAPFDNSLTMGLYVNGRVVGAVDVPELANVTVEILEFTERNGGSVTDWYLGSFHDYDNGDDSVNIDRDISTAWAFNRPAKDQAWGQIKLPFGCGQEPMINLHGMYGSSSPYNGLWDWYGYWDSCYTWMTMAPGHYSQNLSDGDGEAHFTLAQKDFGALETWTVGIAHFGLFGLANAESSAEIAPLAKLVNKWAGAGRGDVNNDGSVDLADIIYLANTVNNGTPGAIPFKHLSDVNCDGNIDMLDVDYLIDYYFWCGPCPCFAWVF